MVTAPLENRLNIIYATSLPLEIHPILLLTHAAYTVLLVPCILLLLPWHPAPQIYLTGFHLLVQ